VGEIIITINDNKITGKSYKNISLKGKTNVNEEIKTLVKSYSQNPMLNEVLGKAKVKLSGNEELGCFYTDALREMNHFDMVFQNSGGIRIHDIPEGDITVETIYKMDPFGNYLMGLDMTAEEIKSLIKNSSKEGDINLRVSGIQYTIVKENKLIKEIQLTDYNGKPIDENRKYFVGLNDYILSTYQFPHTDKGKSQGVTTAQVVMEYLKKVGEINYSGVKRTFVKDLEAK
jgi:5'-nucleotidase / UDP-sugar diphosphatase